MIKNFFKTAFRQFVKNKWYTIIHVVGLTLGLATSLVLLMLVKHEWSFDKQWDNSEQIFRVSSRFTGVFEGTNPGITAPAGKALQLDFPEFSDVARIFTTSGPISVPDDGDQPFLKNQLAFVDTAFFRVFPNWEWKYGQNGAALEKPGQIVLSDQTAEKYFGKIGPDIVGREIFFRDSVQLEVAGIFAKQEKNTDLLFEGYISLPTLETTWLKEDAQLDNWSSTNSNSQVFVRTAAGVTAENAQSCLSRLEERQVAENPEEDWRSSFVLVPLKAIHFDQEFGLFNASPSPMRKSTLIGLALISLFLLALACFNFVNLEIAKAALRSKEIGVRKVLGGTRRLLIIQFLGETAILASLAALLTNPLIEIFYGYFGDFLPPSFEWMWFSWETGILLLFLVATVTICSGLYPAWIVTNVQVADSVKGLKLSGKYSKSSGRLRKGLIAGQFFVTQVLLIGALVVWKQTDFAINKDMGFDQDLIVNFNMPWQSNSNGEYDKFQTHIEQNADVEKISRFAELPARNGYSTSVYKYEKEGQRFDINVHRKPGDTAYIDLFGLELLAGRNYLPRDSIDEFVINERFAKTMGYSNPIDAIGSFLYSNEESFPVVGVVKDFHVEKLHKAVPPVLLAYRKSRSLGVKINANSWQNVDQFLAYAKPHWEELWPRNQFRYNFIDEQIEKLYEGEVRTAKLLTGGTIIALCISCMGLLGLAAFLAHQRTKEIGIRKVLGASVQNIMSLLSWDFLKWILIALAPASIVGYFLTKEWLNGFAYQFNFNGLLILLAATGSIVIAAMAVLVQGYRAAQLDPVDSLRSE